MTDIREKVAKTLYYQHLVTSTKWEHELQSIRDRYLFDADQILALIVDEDAELPPNPYAGRVPNVMGDVYHQAQQDILAQHRLVRKEE